MRLLTTEEGAQVDMAERANKALAADRSIQVEQTWAMILIVLEHVGGRIGGQITDDGAAILATIGKGNYAPQDSAEQSDLRCLTECLPRTQYGWGFLEAIVALRFSKRNLRVVNISAKAA